LSTEDPLAGPSAAVPTVEAALHGIVRSSIGVGAATVVAPSISKVLGIIHDALCQETKRRILAGAWAELQLLARVTHTRLEATITTVVVTFACVVSSGIALPVAKLRGV
jgi:hypothetical protein